MNFVARIAVEISGPTKAVVERTAKRLSRSLNTAENRELREPDVKRDNVLFTRTETGTVQSGDARRIPEQ